MQGEVQCCVTGPAFERMLQLPDLSIVETVMRNVVVFARMKSHQKGQVMDLLGSRGIHQSLQDQQRHIPVRAPPTSKALQGPQQHMLITLFWQQETL